jgi:hypothetical protein
MGAPVPRRARLFKRSGRPCRIEPLDGTEGSGINARQETRVPSLIRFLIVIGVLGGLAWLGMLALVNFVEPEQREMSTPIPANRLNR